ncbi:MAG TPA: hypothetical protein VL137_01290 [Polyangiaceae bacterium]|nr:hypothetical protein [Polyangiaceae bacterium]
MSIRRSGLRGSTLSCEATLLGGLLAAGLLLSAARPAVAQSQSGIAEALYEEGRTLVGQGKYAEACPKFAESYKQEAGVGTLLNLASCNEQLGKTATAWSEFTEAYELLSRTPGEPRTAYAQEHRDALASKLSRVAIDVPARNRLSGLVVTLDGAEVGSAAWSVMVPIDPGKHVVKASAPGCVPWDGSVTVGASADKQTVSIPLLHAAAAPAKPPPAAVANQSTTAATPNDQGMTRPVTAPVVILGVATIGLAAGAGVTGALYLKKKGDFDAINGKTGVSSTERDQKHNDAATMANINVALTAGAVATGVATLIFYFTTPKEPKTAFVPWFDQHAAGASVIESF